MTEQEKLEIKSFLRSKGLSDSIIRWALSAAENEERVEEFRGSNDAKRYQELRNFEPNPGKATLTQVGETQTYLGGDDHGLPIYQEDIDMINKALPLAKRLIELQKVKSQEPVEEKPLSEMTEQERIDNWSAQGEKEEQTLRTLRDTIDEVYDVKPEDLNMGPDTTENINEVRVDDIPGLEYYEATGRQPRTPIEKYYVREHMKRLKPEEREHYEKLFTTENHGRKVPDNGDAAYQGYKKYGRMPREEKTPELIIDEQCNKNVSQPTNKDLPFPGDITKYSYSNILRRMDDTHTRKNNDYGDAAYQGYKKYGPAYFLVQLHNKLTRLESLTVNNKTQQVKDESIDDTLLDMANYAVMYLESRHRND